MPGMELGAWSLRMTQSSEYYFLLFIDKKNGVKVMEVTWSEVGSKLGIWDLNPSLSVSKVHALSKHLRLLPWASLSLLFSPLFIIYYFYRTRKTLFPQILFHRWVCPGIFKMGTKTFKGTKIFSKIFFFIKLYPVSFLIYYYIFPSGKNAPTDLGICEIFMKCQNLNLDAKWSKITSQEWKFGRYCD